MIVCALHERQMASESDTFYARKVGRFTIKAGKLWNVQHLARGTVSQTLITGGVDMATVYSLDCRYALRHNQIVLASLSSWWRTVCRLVVQWDTTVTCIHSELRIHMTEYIAIMHKVYKALATTYVEEEALRLLREEWGYDSRDRETIGKQEFYDAMFELADVWAITSSASEYAGFLDKLLTFLSDGNDLIEDQNIAVGGGLPTVYTYMDADTGDNGEGAGISASVGTAASVGIAKAAAGRWRQSSSVYQVSALERRARQARTKVYHWRERQHAAVTIQRNARVQIIRMVMVGRKLLVKQADNEAEPLGKQGASIGSCFTRHVGPMPSTLSTSSHRSPIIYSSGACSVTRTRPAGAEAASDSLPFRSTPLCASALSLSFKLPPLSPPKRSYHKDTIEADKRLPAGYGVPLSGACPFAALSPLERPRIMLTPEEHLKGMTKGSSSRGTRGAHELFKVQLLRPGQHLVLDAREPAWSNGRYGPFQDSQSSALRCQICNVPITPLVIHSPCPNHRTHNEPEPQSKGSVTAWIGATG